MEATVKTNSRRTYLYRDGSNDKRWGTVVFRGNREPALVQRLLAALTDDGFFVAHQVLIPELFFEDAVGDAGDHCFHEFAEVPVTRELADDAYGRTFEQFVAEMERASTDGWSVFDRADPLCGVH